MSTTFKHGLFGFLFGTLGMFAFSALSLLSQVFEFISAPLFRPGRFLAATFVGSEGSDLAVAMLTISNGILYAIIFILIGMFVRRSKRA